MFILSSVVIKMFIGSKNWLYYSICWFISVAIVYYLLGENAFSKEDIDSGLEIFIAMIIGIAAFFTTAFITGVVMDNPLALNLSINSGISAFITVNINASEYTQDNEE